MPPNSIVITQNPVTLWESFHLTLGRDREDFDSYVKDDRAMGGYWGCSFKMFHRENVLIDFFENGLGRNVESFGYGIQTLHEGFIYDMLFNIPPDQYTISLQNVINKLWMRSDYDADGEVERSTVLQNTPSQAKYGVIERVMGGGELDSLSVADQAAQTHFNLRAFPKVTINRGAGRGRPYLDIYSKGYIETLAWRTFNTLVGGTQGMSVQFADVIVDAQFVASSVIEGNTTVVIKDTDIDLTILDIILNLARLGDANYNRWLTYMIKGRVLHLKQAAPATVE